MVARPGSPFLHFQCLKSPLVPVTNVYSLLLATLMISRHIPLKALEHGQLVMYFNGASITMLVYDYFLTFPAEVFLIWPTRWNYVKVLFLLTRYLPFVDVALHIYNHKLSDPDPETCLLTFKIMTWLICVGLALPESILTLRAWAVWNRDWRLGIGLPILFIVCWGPSIGIIIIFLNSLEFPPLRMPGLLGCVVIPRSNITFICWTLLLIYDFVIFMLMLIRGIKCYRRGGRSELIHIVFRDGLLYYTVLFAFSSTNVVLSPDIQAATVLAQRFVHSIIACRVILDIRGQAMNVAHPACQWLDGNPSIPKSSHLTFHEPSTEVRETSEGVNNV